MVRRPDGCGGNNPFPDGIDDVSSLIHCRLVDSVGINTEFTGELTYGRQLIIGFNQPSAAMRW